MTHRHLLLLLVSAEDSLEFVYVDICYGSD